MFYQEILGTDPDVAVGKRVRDQGHKMDVTGTQRLPPVLLASLSPASLVRSRSMVIHTSGFPYRNQFTATSRQATHVPATDQSNLATNCMPGLRPTFLRLHDQALCLSSPRRR